MGAVSVLAAFFTLSFGFYRIARVCFRLPSGLPSAIGAFVLAWTWLTITTLALGQLGYLTRTVLLLCSIVVLIPGLICIPKPTFGPELPPSPSERLSLGAGLAIGLTIWAVAGVMLTSIIFPVNVTSDGPIYHLYFAAKWWKAERIFLIPTPFGESAAPYFPAVGDLWHTWLFVTWGGDRLARIGQLPFLIASFAIAYALCRSAGASRSSSFIAVCCFLTVGPVLSYSAKPNVDTLFLAGYLAAVYFGLRYFNEGGGLRSLALAGLAAGAAWGCKPTSIVFIPPLLLLIAVGVLLRPTISKREKLGAIAILAITSLVNEGYWLVRNAVWTGNPLYPLHLTLFGHTILAGWYDADAMSTSVYYVAIGRWREFIDFITYVLDPRLAPVWLAALLGAWKWGRERRLEDRVVWLCAGLAIVNVALFWVAIPYRSQLRFLIQAIGLAAIPLASLLDRGWLIRGVVAAALTLHILTPAGWPLRADNTHGFWELGQLVPTVNPGPISFLDLLSKSLDPTGNRRVTSIGLLVVGGGFLLLGLAMHWPRVGGQYRRPFEALCFIALCGGFVLATIAEHPLEKSYKYAAFQPFLNGWATLDVRIPPSGTRIAYAGTNLPYYLMGPDFRNEVFYIDVNKYPGLPMHKFHAMAESLDLDSTWSNTRPGWDRARPNYRDWLDNLHAAGIKILVVTRADPSEGFHLIADKENFTIERYWADSHPNDFKLIYGDTAFKFYSVNAPASR